MTVFTFIYLFPQCTIHIVKIDRIFKDLACDFRGMSFYIFTFFTASAEIPSSGNIRIATSLKVVSLSGFFKCLNGLMLLLTKPLRPKT